MKLNEQLQIGDFVKHKELNKIMTVEELRRDGTVVLLDGLQASVEDIEPIPLTVEILEKNFKPFEFEGQTYYDYSTDFADVSISEFTDGLWEVKIDEIEFGGLPTWKMYVCDVHQLQHAFRMACIFDVNIKI